MEKLLLSEQFSLLDKYALLIKQEQMDPGCFTNKPCFFPNFVSKSAKIIKLSYGHLRELGWQAVIPSMHYV